MALIDLALPTESELALRPIPASVQQLIADAERRVDAFNERTSDRPVLAFVQSDLSRAWRGLAFVRERRLLPGEVFCEWGSGIGAVALLAAGVGYRACGIEVEPELVAEAESLARAHDLPVEFVCGSFLPEDADVVPQDMDEFAWLDCSAPSAYDELELDPDDFDLIYAYPWPGEQHIVYDLFDEYGSPGACLLTHHGVEGLTLHRKK